MKGKKNQPFSVHAATQNDKQQERKFRRIAPPLGDRFDAC
jgi:hypothetical protein